MTGVGDAFGLPFKDPQWFSKLLVQGLITLIPIVGAIALAGYTLQAYENYRAGRTDLPIAGFPLGKGFQLFVVGIVYVLAVLIPFFVLAVIGQKVGLFAVLGILYVIAADLLLVFVSPAMYVRVARAGIAGGLDFRGVWADATANPGNSIVAILLIIVAGILGELGAIACFVGLLVTIPYAIAVHGAVLAWFDQNLVGGPTAPPVGYTPAPPPPPAAPIS